MHYSPRRKWPGPVRWVAVLSSGLGLLSCSGSHEPPRMPPQVGHVQVAPTTDVPALLGLSIDTLRQRLGPPQPLPRQFTTSQASALLYTSRGRRDSLLAFRTGGLLMLATYNTQSRRVRDFLLLGHHEDSLMGRAHLRAGAGSYLVMPVFRDSRSFRLLGLRVIPTN
ncbi:hypothetical protein FNT36_01495 [Hymenobacter setariae]|uniref:Uncharacterized protein n=1 Tax=Hymenobacter setariae TaxID=2594794 RepID=A0A558C1X1_9BACT|nr:hypothetical protein [Hymenobacter setariae]TVT42795.1 hypothetical protein FNT36_01495 [Hymenobacter setariae]